jgi:hypothetical protein
MAKSQLAPSEDAQHVNLEVSSQQKVVKAVMEKWEGAGFPARSNEGMVVQSAIEKCQSMSAEAQAVAPKGEAFGVQGKALSDRVYAKYGGENQMSSPSGKSMGASKKALSDRNYKK